MELNKYLTTKEKSIFLNSIPIVKKNIEFFVIRFYYYFLQSKAGLLFQGTNIENQYKILNSSFNFILTQIIDESRLEEQFYKLITTHVEYKVIPEHIDDFIESFKKAFEEIFSDDSEKKYVKVWFKIISEIMLFFKTDL